MSYELTGSQKTFVRELAAQTGLNTKTLQAWVLAEMGGKTSSAARQREASKNYNWLNIAYYDTGPGAITKDKAWRNPKSAARATAQFLRGERFGPSPGIRKIIRTAGQDVDSQINAIANSGWASSGYGGGSVLRSLAGKVEGLHGIDTPKKSRGVVQTGSVLSASSEDARAAALQAYVANRGRPGALLALASGLEDAELPAGGAVAAPRSTDRQTNGSGGSGRSAKAQGLSPLLEMFWQGQGGVNVDNGKLVRQGYVPGHTDHVHVAAGPKTLNRLDRRAADFGLRVSSADRPGAVTSSGNTSFHAVGKARDYAGRAKQMAAFAQYVARLYGVQR